jgi:hypothetical protein
VSEHQHHPHPTLPSKERAKEEPKPPAIAAL